MNITHNFTANQSLANLNNEQPLAVMPAGLAKKLLKMYADMLYPTSNARIINSHIEELTKCADAGDLQGAIEKSMEWLAERELINNAANQYWEAYEVKGAMIVNEVSASQL